MNETQRDILDGWIEETEKIKVPSKVTFPRRYDEKLVAFIDVLGMTELMKDKQIEAEEILTTLSEIQQYVNLGCEKLMSDQKLDLLHIGDGCVIVTDVEQLGKVCFILSTIQWRALVYAKKLIRGVLTIGRVRVDGRLFVGPAIIDAYKYERENAIYPRIIVLHDLDELMQKKSFKFNYIHEDQDKVKYIDFIRHNFEQSNLTNKTFDHLLTTEGVKNTILKEYTTLLNVNNSDNVKIAQKYGWLITKLNEYNIKIL